MESSWTDEWHSATLGDEEIAAAIAVVKSGILAYSAGGPHLRSFEKDFAAYHQSKHAVMTTSGTASLELALAALGIGPGDDVIIPSFTFIAPASAVHLIGGQPVFADIDLETFCIDPSDLRLKVTEKTKAVIVVHAYGTPANMDDVCKVAREFGLYIIEDCAQAHGALFRQQIVGSLGDVACFSFFQTKNMTCGQGGMVVTNSDSIAERVKALRNHGRLEASPAYEYTFFGRNYVPTELQAVIAQIQLSKLHHLNTIRQQNAEYIREALRGYPIMFQKVLPECSHVYYKLSGLLTASDTDKRNQVVAEAQQRGVWLSILYPSALCCLPLLRRLGLSHCQVAEQVASSILNINVSPNLGEEGVARTITSLKDSL